ncbi:MAG: porin [Acidobacteriota bacterium]
MKALAALLLLLCLPFAAGAQQAEPHSRLKQLEDKLDDALGQLEKVAGMIQSLRAEISQLRADNAGAAGASRSAIQSGSQERRGAVQSSSENVVRFSDRIIDSEIGRDEHETQLAAKPEVFIQTRYAAAPIRTTQFDANFSLTRIETRWAGKVNEKLGAGLEIQFHPAAKGSAEELVNDAFVEYYAGKNVTIRAGQFIKPFGFDVQQSSSVRESPERGMFAGYFFPGQRDRGVMIFGDLDSIDGRALKNVHYFLGAFNGNRFFADNNRQMNYVARVRKFFERPRLALGVSLQRGKQPLPPGVAGSNDENLAGADLQLALGRFGLRTEFVAGNMPSTLLGTEPQFAPAFHPGARSAGGHIFGTYRLTGKDNIYARYDQFNGDPVTGNNVRAFNLGYFRPIGEMSRLGFDYQFKNRPSFNDDAVNGRFHITWNIEF